MDVKKNAAILISNKFSICISLQIPPGSVNLQLANLCAKITPLVLYTHQKQHHYSKFISHLRFFLSRTYRVQYCYVTGAVAAGSRRSRTFTPKVLIVNFVGEKKKLGERRPSPEMFVIKIRNRLSSWF